LDDYNYNINVKIDPITVKINECDQEQIKIYYKRNSKIFYCEQPLCLESCSNNTKCIKQSDDIHVNDKNLNICKCVSGWKGINCDEKIYINFR